jgi:hypothetical protein
MAAAARPLTDFSYANNGSLALYHGLLTRTAPAQLSNTSHQHALIRPSLEIY